MPNQPNFPIPSEVNPDNTRCICIQVPDNDDWIRVFVGLLAQPTYWFNWQRDSLKQGKDCADVWTKLFDQIDWSDMSCCCPDNPSSTTNNILNMQIALQLQQLDDGTVGSYAPDAPNETFSTDSRDSTPAEVAATVATLCQACNSWVRQVLNDAMVQASTTTTELGAIGIAVGFFNPLAGVILSLIALLPYANLLEIANDHDAVEEVICALNDDLKGADVSFENFEGALGSFLSENDHANQLAGMVVTADHDKRNFRAFMVYLQSKVSGAYDGCVDCGEPPPVSFYTPALGWFTVEPTTHSPSKDTYEITSSYTGGDPENRISIMGGQTPDTYPGTLCVPIKVEALNSPTYDYRTTFDCEGVESGSHGVPVPTGNYTQVDVTNNPGNPPFIIRFTVYRDPIP